MINFKGFPKSSPSVVTIGQDAQLVVSYSIDFDSAQTITTTYSEVLGCTIIGQKSFNHAVNKGVNKLNDTITIKVLLLHSTIQLQTCTAANDCTLPHDLGIIANEVNNHFTNAIAALTDVRIESVFMLNTESGPIFINESKKKIHQFLKDNGYAFDKSKKIWKHGKDKN